MAFCTYCGQEFRRTEHLERHLARHSNVKRFKCHICHASFSRADVLRRHISIHGEEGCSPSSTPTDTHSVKQRTAKACANCAKAKAKCDAKTPCRRCTVKQLECRRLLPRRERGRNNNETSPLERVEADTESATEDSRPRPTIRANIASAEETSQSVPMRQDPEGESDQDTVHMSNGQAVNTRDYTAFDYGTVIAHATNKYAHSTEQTSPALVPQDNADLQREPWMVDNCNLDAETDNPPVIHSMENPNAGIISPQFGESGCDTLHLYSGNHTGQDMPQALGSDNAPDDSSAPILTPVSHGLQHSHSDAPVQVQDDLWLTFPEASVVAEHPAMVEALPFWSYFRCNPHRDISVCPRTGGVLIGSLSHIPPSDDLWGWLDLNNTGSTAAVSFTKYIAPLYGWVRDKLSVISQGFLRKALDVHCFDPAALNNTASQGMEGSYLTALSASTNGFLILPPAATLEHFLSEYMTLFEPFYTLVPGGLLNVNTLMQLGNPSHATILILLMIGQGAMTESTVEARRLSGGLTEVCRISLFDAVEKNVPACHHYVLMHSAFLFVIQAAWSGDKWLMDIGLGQRGIYMFMLHHATVFESVSESLAIHLPPDEVDAESVFYQWRDTEQRIRLAYNWLILDLELSLFHDVNTALTLADVKLPLPHDLELFLAEDSDIWRQRLQSQIPDPVANESSGAHYERPNFQLLMQWFLELDVEGSRRKCLNSTALHVLLHALHNMIRSCRQTFGFVGSGSSKRASVFSPFTRASMTSRIEEVQCLLQYWLKLFRSSGGIPWASSDSAEPNSRYQNHEGAAADHHHRQSWPQQCAILITYHLIYLETISDVTAIEELLRQRPPDETLLQMPLQTKERYIQDHGQALFHSGQILCLARTLEDLAQPPWWPAAIYRVTLILTATSALFAAGWKETLSNGALSLSRPCFVIDSTVLADDTGLCSALYGDNTRDRSLNHRIPRGVPNLFLTVKGNMEQLVSLRDPNDVLGACIQGMEMSRSTRFIEGMRRKLQELLNSRTCATDAA